MINKSAPAKVFNVFNLGFLTLLALSCVLPMVHVMAKSLSTASLMTVQKVGLIPLGFTTEAFEKLLIMPQLQSSVLISVLRVLIGTFINMAMVTLTAYPLSRESEELKGRNVIIWFLLVPTLFSSGLIPNYIWVRDLKLIDNFWVMILPGALPLFNAIMMMNFFRNIPRSLYEAALLDGAGHIKILTKVYIPLSMASFATISLFCIVGHWNAWFDAVIYINNINLMPLQAIMRGIISRTQDFARLLGKAVSVEQLQYVSQENLTAAAIIITILPILASYPFLQKYFVTGVVMGSVKE